MISFNFDITISMCQASIFSSDMAMISYFKISTVFTFFNHTTNKIVNSIFNKYDLKAHQTYHELILNNSHNCKRHVFDICSFIIFESDGFAFLRHVAHLFTIDFKAVFNITF